MMVALYRERSRWLTLGVASLALLALTAAFTAVSDAVDDHRRIEALQAVLCHDEARDQVSVTEASITIELALGLAAYSEGNRAEMREHTARVRELTLDLRRAADRLPDAQTECTHG